MSEEICFIAGNVAENAGGGHAAKYGVTGRYIRNLEVATFEGEVFQAGGKRFKDVSGCDPLTTHHPPLPLRYGGEDSEDRGSAHRFSMPLCRRR